MAFKIRLDTFRDATEFADIASTVNGRVTITDGNGLSVNCKSVLGALYAMEFNSLFCDSDVEIYHKISKFIINE